MPLEKAMKVSQYASEDAAPEKGDVPPQTA
jgi:hypothetical protein